MQSILTDHHTISFSTSLVIAILGVLLLLIKFPSSIEWRAIKQGRVYLAISYFILCIAGFISSYVEADSNKTIFEMERAIILVVGSFQALLFTITNLIFVRSSYVNRRNITLNVAIIILVSTLLALTFTYLPELFSTILYIAVGVYCGQLIYYYRLFRKEYKLCVRRLENHYQEDEEERMHWIRNCFYSALCVGILAMISVAAPISVAVLDTLGLLYTLYYAYVLSTVYNYRAEAQFVLQAISNDEILNGSEEDFQSDIEVAPLGEADTKEKGVLAVLNEVELELERALVCWVEKKRYLEADISIDETVAELGVSRVFLRTYFHTHKPTNFRTWKLKLRILEAKRILKDEDIVSMSNLYKLSGFTDRSNFYHHFTKLVGQTPTQYKDSHK